MVVQPKTNTRKPMNLHACRVHASAMHIAPPRTAASTRLTSVACTLTPPALLPRREPSPPPAGACPAAAAQAAQGCCSHHGPVPAAAAAVQQHLAGRGACCPGASALQCTAPPTQPSERSLRWVGAAGQRAVHFGCTSNAAVQCSMHKAATSVRVWQCAAPCNQAAARTCAQQPAGSVKRLVSPAAVTLCALQRQRGSLHLWQPAGRAHLINSQTHTLLQTCSLLQGMQCVCTLGSSSRHPCADLLSPGWQAAAAPPAWLPALAALLPAVLPVSCPAAAAAMMQPACRCERNSAPARGAQLQ